jgi:hypothetical protein
MLGFEGFGVPPPLYGSPTKLGNGPLEQHPPADPYATAVLDFTVIGLPLCAVQTQVTVHPPTTPFNTRLLFTNFCPVPNGKS